MTEELIKAFSDATRKIFQEVTGEELRQTACFTIEGEGKVLVNIATILSFTGSVKGQFVLIMDEPLALKITSAILMGTPVESFDDVAESSVAELGNMIGGEVARRLVDLGYPCDISVPSMIQGKQVAIAFFPKEPRIMLKFASNIGPLSVLTRLEAKKN